MTTPIYALFVLDGAKASDDLAELGLECWHFTYRRFRPGAQWALRNVNGRQRYASRGHAEVRAPMFPGYIFARIPLNRFKEALESPRVVDVVRGAGDMPRQVPEQDFTQALMDVMTGEWDEETAPAPKLRGLDKPLKAMTPKNRTRSRSKRRKGAASRLRKWLTEAQPQHLARAA